MFQEIGIFNGAKSCDAQLLVEEIFYSLRGLLIAKDHRIRIPSIVEQLILRSYDIICLQEIFCQYQIDLISQKFSEINYFFHHFNSGFVGSGLVIISKFPILNPIFFAYPEQGTPFDVGGDWYAGKGVACCTILHPFKSITLLNTHVNAKYSCSPNYEKRAFQLVYLSKIIRSLEITGRPLIVAGDLNTESDECFFHYLISISGINDSFEICHSPDMYTSNCVDNTYIRGNSDKPCRIDYILHGSSFICTKYCHSFSYDFKNNMNYSDHNAVEVVLKLIEGWRENIRYVRKSVLKELHTTLLNGHKNVSFPKLWWGLLIFLFVGFSVFLAVEMCSLIYSHIISFIFLFCFVIDLMLTLTFWVISVHRRRIYLEMATEISKLISCHQEI